MQCTASYPVEPQDMNLSMIPIFRQNFRTWWWGFPTTRAASSCPYRLCPGARVVEKHFTLNHAWKGTDNPFSLEPIGLRKMVRDLRRVHVALGDGEKKVLPGEAKPLLKMARSWWPRMISHRA